MALIAGCAAPVAPQPAEGCYVHAFAGEEYRPPLTTYTGPTHEPLLMRGASSLIVGPGAKLEGQRVFLGSGAKVPRLDAAGIDWRVESFQIVCEEP